jgi:hypothetical protein
MFECDRCKNRNSCKQKEAAKNLQKDIKKLKIKYKKFYGSIIDKCDYYIAEESEIGQCSC